MSCISAYILHIRLQHTKETTSYVKPSLRRAVYYIKNNQLIPSENQFTGFYVTKLENKEINNFLFYIFFIILKQPFTPQDYQRCLAILNDLLSNISPRQVKITLQRKSSIFKKCVFIIDFQQVFVHRANIFQTIIWCNYSWIRTNTVAYTIINVLQFVGNMAKGRISRRR